MVVNYGALILSIKNLPTIRIYIDAIGGATIEDCEKISTELNYEMPIYDFLSDFSMFGGFHPGLDRKFFYFDQFQQYIGEKFLLSLKIR